VPALAAISTSVVPSDEERIPDSGALARLLYFSAGITKTLRFPWGAMPFRAAACTGALYHIELYVVCGELPGLEAGVYHFDPQDMSLKVLRAGDYRAVLVDASGSEPHVAHAPAVIVCTDVFWRNAVKYQAREYRHAFWDSGTILAHTLAVAAAHRLPAKVVMGFVDETVNRLLDLDAEREVALAPYPSDTSRIESAA
jgi:SagB-type dehydrogenase family enzyme